MSGSHTTAVGEGDAAGPRVLVVDDDDLFRESLGHNLKDAGYAVTEAATGQAALDRLAAEHDFALVLLDWKMPGMNGIEVLRRMRQSGLTIPVIFLTVLGNQIYEEAALQGGAVDFVEKTRSFGILLKRIGLIIDGRKGEPAAASAAPEDETSFRRGALELRRDSGRAFWADAEVPLTITEFRMVDFLATRAGQDVAYRDLYDIVHGPGFTAGYGEDGYRANVRAFVKRIRRKFRELDDGFDEIESYSGFGYRWREREDSDS
ncbi:MAG: response regulator [Azospirillum sp.]|nr:response regulator [Azospirillum sp.]